MTGLMADRNLIPSPLWGGWIARRVGDSCESEGLTRPPLRGAHPSHKGEGD
jgi:hypothetical protein